MMKQQTKDFLQQTDRFIERIFPFAMPAGVLLGFALPQVFGIFRPFVPALFAIVTLAGALKLRTKALGQTFTSPLPFLFFFLFARVVMPTGVFFISSFVFRNQPEIIPGYILLYAVPTAVTSFIWVSIYKGDAALALTLILLDTILAPIVTPATVFIFLGARINLDAMAMSASLFFMVVLPTIVGVATNELSSGKIPALISPVISPLSKVVVFTVVAANASAVSHLIRFDNARLWIIVAVSTSLIVISFSAVRFLTLAGKFNPEKQVTLLYTSSLRNSAAAMTLAIRYFPEAGALPAVLGILFQQTSAGVMGRIFFGKKNGKQAGG
jgi:tagaturonate reductase